MTKKTIPTEWWKGQYFFGKRYMEPDNSIDGYIPGKKETLEERTQRECKGVIDLLKLPEGARILDVPCGYGRHCIGLSKLGYKVTGIDINEEHLAKAINDSGDCIRYFNRDMRNIGNDMHEKFDAVINMFYSFGFFEDEEENYNTMKEFYNALKDGDQMLIHTDVSPEMLTNNTTQTDAVRKLPGNKKLIILEKYNPATRRMEGSWETTDSIGNIIHPRSFYSVRIYSAQGFRSMAEEIGFKDISIYGSFAGEPFNDESNEMIVVAKKRK